MFIKRRQAGPASTCTLLISSLSETDKLPELGGGGGEGVECKVYES